MYIDVNVFCDCGTELDHVDTNYTTNGVEIIVKQCESCVEAKGSQKYDEGYEKGRGESMGG